MAVMNTASVPYSTALLITMSISYSRYFSTAMPTAASRHRTDRFRNTFAGTELVRITVIKATTTTTAAAANHFSCSRSSPTERANRTTTAARLTSSAAGQRASSTVTTAGVTVWLNDANGCDQVRVAPTSTATVPSPKATPTNHAAGSHRRERSRPVGKSRNRKAIAATGIPKVQLASHIAARAAGTDPGAATRPCAP